MASVFSENDWYSVKEVDIVYKPGDMVELRPWDELEEQYGLDNEGDLNLPSYYLTKVAYDRLNGKYLFVEDVDTDETVRVTGLGMIPMWVPACVLKKCEAPTMENPKKEGAADTQEHYKKASMQPVEVMQTLLTTKQFEGFLLGNVIKYRMRAPFKGQRESDLGKARQYAYWYSLVHGGLFRRIDPVNDVPPKEFDYEGIFG